MANLGVYLHKTNRKTNKIVRKSSLSWFRIYVSFVVQISPSLLFKIWINPDLNRLLQFCYCYSCTYFSSCLYSNFQLQNFVISEPWRVTSRLHFEKLTWLSTSFTGLVLLKVVYYGMITLKLFIISLRSMVCNTNL